MKLADRHYAVSMCFLVAVITVIAVFETGYLHPYMKLAVASLRFGPDIDLYTGNDSVIRQPYDYILICMIITTPSNWETKGKAVRNTWAKRCHKAIFFYSKINNCASQSICKYSDAVGLDVPEGRDHLTAKTLGALSYSFNKYGKIADYFLKADDDTFVIMENLQLILSNVSSIPLLYMGRTSYDIIPKGYNSGGGGYVLSNQAAKILVRNGTSFPNDCQRDGGFEDVEIGRCLAKFGIYPQNDLDPTGRLTFHGGNPTHVFAQSSGGGGGYYINLNGAEFGNKQMEKSRGFMLSNGTATMHYVSPAEMYMYEFLLYHLKRSVG